MIKFSDDEVNRLRNRHQWLADFGNPAPIGLASLENPISTALHFVDKKRQGLLLPDWPDGACVLVPPGMQLAGARSISVKSPKVTIGHMLNDLRAMRQAGQRFAERDGAWLAAGLAIPKDCCIEPGAVIFSGVVLEPQVEIGANAVVRTGVRIGKGSRIQSGAKIGDDGFGYAFDDNGGSFRLPHMGGVEIGAGVDVGANSVICAGTIDPTGIGSGSRIDGDVYIGHNVKIGSRSWIIAGTVVGGSSIIGDDVWVNTSAMVRTKIKIGDRAIVGAGAIVMKDVPPGTTVMGDVATEVRSRMRRIAMLDEIVRRRDTET